MKIKNVFRRSIIDAIFQINKPPLGGLEVKTVVKTSKPPKGGLLSSVLNRFRLFIILFIKNV
jgi:hypothetical protein